MMGVNHSHLFYGMLGLALVASLPLFAQSSAPSAASSLQVQVQDVLKICFQCHGEGAVSLIPTRPTIAGQKAEYIRRQLTAFKNTVLRANDNRDTGAGAALIKRTDPVMEHMAAGIADSLIDPVAQALSNLACDGGTAKAPRTNPLALPPSAQTCAVCHGVDGISSQNQVPNLAGQQRAYLRRQLLLIRETAWGAQPREGEAWRGHPIMEAQAARLPIAGIDAIASYFSELDCRGGGVK